MHDMARVQTTMYQNIQVRTNTCHYAHAILVCIGTYKYKNMYHICTEYIHTILKLYIF